MPAVRGTEPWVEWRLDADLAVLTQSYRDVEPLLPESSMEADGEGFAIGGGNACSSLILGLIQSKPAICSPCPC